MRWVRLDRITVHPDLAAPFPIGDAELAAITESMRERRFDQAEPLVIWNQGSVLVDGHTRLAGAKAANLDHVYVVERDFADLRDALEYAIARQRDRRNLSRQQLQGFTARAILALDKVKPEGRPPETAS